MAKTPRRIVEPEDPDGYWDVEEFEFDQWWQVGIFETKRAAQAFVADLRFVEAADA